jgi:hypothetical protein
MGVNNNKITEGQEDFLNWVLRYHSSDIPLIRKNQIVNGLHQSVFTEMRRISYNKLRTLYLKEYAETKNKKYYG